MLPPFEAPAAAHLQPGPAMEAPQPESTNNNTASRHKLKPADKHGRHATTSTASVHPATLLLCYKRTPAGSQSVYRHGSPLTLMLTKAQSCLERKTDTRGGRRQAAERETAAPDHKTLPFNPPLSRHGYNIRTDWFTSRA